MGGYNETQVIDAHFFIFSWVRHAFCSPEFLYLYLTAHGKNEIIATGSTKKFLKIPKKCGDFLISHRLISRSKASERRKANG